jgi:hypothetical protein
MPMNAASDDRMPGSSVRKAPRLSRERGLGAHTRHEGIEVARVDSVNDRFEDLFRRCFT